MKYPKLTLFVEAVFDKEYLKEYIPALQVEKLANGESLEEQGRFCLEHLCEWLGVMIYAADESLFDEFPGGLPPTLVQEMKELKAEIDNFLGFDKEAARAWTNTLVCEYLQAHGWPGIVALGLSPHNRN